jgi:O-antigen/teichoic acid export membrane protein
MFLNIILNFIFIPKYTYIGAAWVSLNSTVIDLFIRIHFVRKVLGHKVNYFSMLSRPLVALAAMLITLFLLETIFLPVRVLIALVPYILLLRLLNVYSKEEIDRFIKEPFSKIVSHVRGQR